MHGFLKVTVKEVLDFHVYEVFLASYSLFLFLWFFFQCLN